jgi:predicted RNA-binding protein with PUA-like domain
MKKTSKKKASKPTPANSWLMKTEPDVFSIQDLANSPNQTTSWIGVRNYQARNYMRDQMQLGDRILIYHSNAKPSCVVGTASVVKTSHPDHTAWDKASPYFDPKSSPDNPRWFMVDVKLEALFETPQSLEMLRAYPKLSDMMLLKKGMRLSVQPVTPEEFEFIAKLGLG